MAKVRDVLKHLGVETARAKRKCHRNAKHEIVKGELHLAIYSSSSGERKNYCAQCAGPILSAAEERLAEIKAKL